MLERASSSSAALEGQGSRGRARGSLYHSTCVFMRCSCLPRRELFVHPCRYTTRPGPAPARFYVIEQRTPCDSECAPADCSCRVPIRTCCRRTLVARKQEGYPQSTDLSALMTRAAPSQLKVLCYLNNVSQRARVGCLSVPACPRAVPPQCQHMLLGCEGCNKTVRSEKALNYFCVCVCELCRLRSVVNAADFCLHPVSQLRYSLPSEVCFGC